MSRARLFILIDSFEQDLRSLVEHYLSSAMSEEDLYGVDLPKLLARRNQDSPNDDVPLVHYLDLRPCLDLLLRHKKELSHEISDELSSNANQLDILVPIRHKVMHGRPLGMDDPDRALTAVAAFTSRHWVRTRAAMEHLQKDPAWEPAFERRKAANETVLHNLPEPDYDETGFVGRQEEIARLMTALKTGRDNIITVTGEGGIGKTSLALDVAYRLVDSEDNPFEAILWVSLKTEKLTANGVVELNDAIRGIDETVVALGRNLSSDFNGQLDELAESLDGIRCLIIIDNLESAQGDEVIELYERLPTSIRYLFTSRLGIGQLERRYPLPSLSEPESKLLFKKFAAMRRQKSLAALSDKTLTETLARLRFSPLAIKWYILSAEAGKPPLDTLRSQQELLDFCVKNVFDGLAESSRAVLFILRSLDRGISFEEFAVLTEMSIDDLRASTQELTRGALVVVEAETAGAIGARLALTATARAFLPHDTRSGAFIEQVMQRERQYKATLQATAVESQKLDQARVVPRDDADHPAVHLLYTALSFATASRFEQAISQVERARAFNPEFSEVYRVKGYIESLQGHNEAALSELKTALTYAKEPWPNAAASYLLADILARRIHSVALALPYAQQAFERWPCDETRFLLGRTLVWSGEYERGQELLEQALETATGRHRLVVASAHVDSWASAAAASLKSRDPASALQKAVAGFHSGSTNASGMVPDRRFTEAMVECCIVYLQALPQLGTDLKDHSKQLIKFGRYVEANSAMIATSKKWVPLNVALRKVSAAGLDAGAVNALERAKDALARETVVKR